MEVNLPATDRSIPAPEAITVVLCANPLYFQHLAVAARSVVDNAPGALIDFHVLFCDPDPEAEAKLHECWADSERVSFQMHHVDGRVLDALFVDGYLTKETYLRFLVAEILPNHIEKIIYLDCDVVVLEDLRRLWAEDRGGKLLAAAPDHPRLPLLSRDRLLGVGIPVDVTYVNAGVLLIDRVRWRQTRTSSARTPTAASCSSWPACCTTSPSPTPR